MFQERVLNPQTQNLDWRQIALYPFRYGTLIDAYRTGSGVYDIVHFYVQLAGLYVAAKARGPFLNPALLVGPSVYAGLVDFPIVQSEPSDDESSAYQIIEQIQA